MQVASAVNYLFTHLHFGLNNDVHAWIQFHADGFKQEMLNSDLNIAEIPYFSDFF